MITTAKQMRHSVSDTDVRICFMNLPPNVTILCGQYKISSKYIIYKFKKKCYTCLAIHKIKGFEAFGLVRKLPRIKNQESFKIGE